MKFFTIHHKLFFYNDLEKILANIDYDIDIWPGTIYIFCDVLVILSFFVLANSEWEKKFL